MPKPFLLVSEDDAQQLDTLSIHAYELVRCYSEITTRGGKGRSVANIRRMKEVIVMLRRQLSRVEDQCDRLIDGFTSERN